MSHRSFRAAALAATVATAAVLSGCITTNIKTYTDDSQSNLLANSSGEATTTNDHPRASVFFSNADCIPSPEVECATIRPQGSVHFGHGNEGNVSVGLTMQLKLNIF